jgi:predicted metal-dependent peptidase
MGACKENPDKNGNGEGFGDPTDDHGVWAESTESKEVAEGIIRDAANKAQQATGIGNMPSDMLREIANMNKASVNWKRELRQFFSSALNYEFTKTRNRRNRRYGVVQPGRKKKPQLNIAVCVDSSGSVSDASFTQFFAEITEISKMEIEITILDADCQVQSVYKFDPKKQVQRTGAGGTAYGPAITKAKELGVDGIVYFGDFDCADTPEDPGLPFLWAGVGNQPAPASFGKVIRVLEKQ